MSTQFDPAQDGNLFPREDLLEAVAESDWRDRPVPWFAWALLSVGLVVLALGLPLEAVVHRAETETAAGLSGWRAVSAPLLFAAKTFGQGTGIGIEATLFLLSALGTGLSFLLTGAALRAFGFRGRLAVACALAAALCPLLVVSGRLPSTAPLAAAGSALLLTACAAPFDPDARGARGYGVRVGLAYLAAASMAIEVAVLAGPAWFALFRRVDPRDRARALLAASPFLITVSLMCAAPALPPGLNLPDTVFWGRTPEVPFPDLAAAGLAPWLAAGALIAAWPMVFARASEERGAPAWLHVWAGFGLALGFLMSRGTALAIPALAVFMGDILVRRARPDGAAKRAALFVAAQVLLCALALHRLARTDSPFAGGPVDVRAGDIVVVDDPNSDAAYLLRRRIGAHVRRPIDVPPPKDGARVLWASIAPPSEAAAARVDLDTGVAQPIAR